MLNNVYISHRVTESTHLRVLIMQASEGRHRDRSVLRLLRNGVTPPSQIDTESRA